MKERGYRAPSVRKAFMILRAIADSPTGLGVSDLAKSLKIGKSTVHGITQTLEELGALARDPILKKFKVGYTLIELGRSALGRTELWEVAKSPMESLMREVGETVFLGVLNNNHVTIIRVVESQNELKITSPPGTRLPLLAGATGRVFLAQLDEKKAKQIVEKMGLTRYTAKSQTDPKKFLSEVAEARQRGYAIDHEEYILGVTAVAAPIRAAALPPAAIWVVGFTANFSPQKMEKVISELKRAAEQISRSLEENAR